MPKNVGTARSADGRNNHEATAPPCHCNATEYFQTKLIFMPSFQALPSFSSKRGRVTEKHVLTGIKRDELGNQTFEVLRPSKRTVYTIPFTYFTHLSHSRHLNHLISEILEQRNSWFEVSAVFVYRKHINEFERFPSLVRKFV